MEIYICSTEMTGSCLSQMDMLTKIGKCKRKKSDSIEDDGIKFTIEKRGVN